MRWSFASGTDQPRRCAVGGEGRGKGLTVLTLESEMTLDGLTGREVTDFMTDCDDERYQSWWPGTHRQFHVLDHAAGEDHVGDLVWMDEYVGSRRLRMAAEVIEASRKS